MGEVNPWFVSGFCKAINMTNVTQAGSFIFFIRMMIPSDDFLRGIETRTSYRCIKIGVPTMRVPKSSIALSISIIDVGMRQS